MPRDIKYMDVKEFREKGYLMEVNRTFFHPLGLALEVRIDDETGRESLGGIWDYRDDPEGINFAWEGEEDRIKAMQKAAHIEQERTVRKVPREKILGYFIQPL